MREKKIEKETERYALKRIVEDVRVILDLNDTAEALLDDEDEETLTLDEIVESKIQDAACYIMRHAPLRLCGKGLQFGGDVAWESQRDGAWGYVQLPQDFLRLVAFQMSDWQRMVRVAITEDDAAYSQQFCEFGGLRGNAEKPVVAIVQYPTGPALEFFSCKTQQAAVKRATYLPQPAVRNASQIETGDEDADGVLIATEGKTIDLPSKLLKAIEYYAAYMTAATLRETDQAKLTMLRAEALQSAEINIE